MKKEHALLIAILLFVGTLLYCERELNEAEVRISALNDELEHMQLQLQLNNEPEILQVLAIVNDGKAIRETLCFSKTQWLQYLCRLSAGVTVSNLQLEEIFKLEEVSVDYPQEVKDFLSQEREEEIILISSDDEHSTVFFGKGFTLGYSQKKGAVSILLTDKDKKIKFQLPGKAAKKLYNAGDEFLLFEREGEIFLLNNEMKLFKLI